MSENGRLCPFSLLILFYISSVDAYGRISNWCVLVRCLPNRLIDVSSLHLIAPLANKKQFKRRTCTRQKRSTSQVNHSCTCSYRASFSLLLHLAAATINSIIPHTCQNALTKYICPLITNARILYNGTI